MTNDNNTRRRGTAAGGVDVSGVQQFTITVNQAPSFAPDTSPPLTAGVGQPYGYPFVATGYPAPAVAKNVWVALALPSSLTRVSNSGSGIWWRNVVTWKVGSLNANATSTFTITFKARTTGKALIGAATASTSPDPNWKNNFAAASITLTR